MFFNFAKSEEQITFLNVFNNKGHPKVICTSLKNHPQDLHCNSFRQSHKLIAVLQTPLQICQEPFGPKYKKRHYKYVKSNVLIKYTHQIIPFSLTPK